MQIENTQTHIYLIGCEFSQIKNEKYSFIYKTGNKTTIPCRRFGQYFITSDVFIQMK